MRYKVAHKFQFILTIFCLLNLFFLISSCSNSTPENTETICDPSSDTDGDWICDKDEEKYGTDPEKPDTDNDGLIDGEEINIYGTDPLDFDSDGEEIGDGAKIIVDTDPRYFWNSGTHVDDNGETELEDFFIWKNRWNVSLHGTTCWECAYYQDHNENRIELSDYYLVDYHGFLTTINNKRFGNFQSGLTVSTGRRYIGRPTYSKVKLGLFAADGIRMYREFYTPSNKTYIRILDFIENPTTLDVHINISIRLKSSVPILGSNIELIKNFTGDMKLYKKYNYAINEGKEFFALSSTYAEIRPSFLNSSDNRNLTITYSFTIPAKKRIILMHIADKLSGDMLSEISQAKDTLGSIGNTLTSDLSLEIKQDIANFSLVDKDEDGLNDAVEQDIGLDPNKADSDEDGLPDGFEYLYNFNPLSPGEEILDTDEDDLNNLEEFLNSSNPRNADSDLDGLQDGEEIYIHNTNLNIGDTDNDGLNDFTEVNETKTDPNLANTDGGKRSDWYELVIDKTDPFNPTDDLEESSVTEDSKLGIKFLVNDVLYQPGIQAKNPLTLENNLGVNSIHKLQVFQKTVPTNIRNENVVRSFHVLINPTDKKIIAKIQLGLLADRKLTSINDGKLDVSDDFTGRYRYEGYRYIDSGAYVYSSQYSKLEPTEIDELATHDTPRYLSEGAYITFNYDIEALQRIIFLVYYIPGSDKPSDATLLKDLWKLNIDDLNDIPLDIKQDIVNFVLLDSDNDKINDKEEIALGLDPNKPDTDDDGLLDGFEYFYGFDYLNTDESLLDPDDDGLNNLTEQILGTLPKDPDTDKNGISDGDDDADLDKLSNSEEYTLGTDILNKDTDNDQFSDYVETINETNPLDSNDKPIPTLPWTLTDDANFEWNIQADGSIFDSGQDRIFDNNGLVLELSTGDLKNENPFKSTDISSSPFSNVTISSKELVAGLAISREVSIPDNADFIRFLDYFHNATNQAIDLEINYQSKTGTDTGDNGHGVGVNVNRARNTYLIYSESYNFGMPVVALIYSDLDARTIPTLSDTSVQYLYDATTTLNVTIPAGERAVVMLFAGQNTDVESAISKADSLVSLQGKALSGIPNEVREDIVNFNVPLE